MCVQLIKSNGLGMLYAFILNFSRYMMLILKEGQVYCLDRDNSVFEVDGLKFPHRKDPHRRLGDTLLDGVSFDQVLIN